MVSIANSNVRDKADATVTRNNYSRNLSDLQYSITMNCGISIYNNPYNGQKFKTYLVISGRTGHFNNVGKAAQVPGCDTHVLVFT